MRLVILVTLLFIGFNVFSQTFGTDYSTIQIQTIINDSSASEGDMYRNYETGTYYIGTTSGALRLMSDFKVKEVDNEMYFEDSTHIFISMKIFADSFKVVRYNKADVNDETESSGNGIQPASIAAVKALTYL